MRVDWQQNLKGHSTRPNIYLKAVRNLQRQTLDQLCPSPRQLDRLCYGHYDRKPQAGLPEVPSKLVKLEECSKVQKFQQDPSIIDMCS